MCGRYRLKDTDVLTAHLRRTFNLPDWVEGPRYNVAPSQDIPVVTADANGTAHLTTMRWGLVPYWEKSEKPKLAPINAQSEGVTEKALFRQAVQKRRCLVPADGFYEWLRLDEKNKVPFDIHLKDGAPFFMAGIYEDAQPGRPATCALLTTEPNELVAKIHHRMPAILDPEEAKRWLAPGPISKEQIATLTAPHPASEMAVVPISSLVNSPRHDGPEILEPVNFVPPPPTPKVQQGELF